MAKNKPHLSTPYSNNVVEQRMGRYTQGGVGDRYKRKVAWWERRNLEYQHDDIIHVVTAGQAKRPDLIATAIYGKPALSWLVLQYNNIVDINTELTTGITIRLPSERRLGLSILTQPTGGNPVKR